MNNKILEQIKNIRKERNITLKTLSDKTEISYNYLLMLEKGMKNNPSLNVLIKIANALEVEIGLFYKS